ncbi:MAG: class I SAM-dependent methyltransferase [Saprospiraceae bacterium]|nr:class I SAM-dependent methyltransferase [Saprospiraceae bacterium]
MERLKQYLPILKNPNTQQKGNFSIEVLNPEKGDYLLIDSTNKDWFPIHEDIPELLTTQLLYPQTLEHFKQYYANHIEDLGLEFPVLATNQQQLEQRAHFDNFSEDDKFSYDDFENLPFWIAVDAFVHEYYNLSAQEECFVLDIGCGNGRSIERFIPENAKIIGIDISRKMLQKAKKRTQASDALLMVGDATFPPFVEDCFDFCITSGVLSNLPNPTQTCQSIHKILKKGGAHLGLENNKSIFRLPFDILNSFISIWKNKKGKEPEISPKILKRWYAGCNIDIDSKTLVFLPPQMFSKNDVDSAKKRLRKSDNFFKSIGFKKQGGLITFKVSKQ